MADDIYPPSTPPAPESEPRPDVSEPPPVAGFDQTPVAPTDPYPPHQPLAPAPGSTVPFEQQAAPPFAGAVTAAPADDAPAVPPAASAPAATTSSNHVATAFIVAILTALVIGGLAGVAGGMVGAKLLGGSVSGLTSGGITYKAPPKITVIPSTTDEPVVAAAAAAGPSVVNIDVSGGLSGSTIASGHPDTPFAGNGSGVAFRSAPGGGTYILTNNHVVDGASAIIVTDASGQSWNAQVVGRDPQTDVAVVKVPGKVPTISIGDSAKLIVGQLTVAIGSPFSLQHTVTSGIISAVGRSLPSAVGNGSSGQYSLVDAIQTDAAINPGNSGGALVDRQGRLIGITTAIYGSSNTSGQGQNAGIGFAIPSDTAINLADQLIKTGTVQYPFLGIIGQTSSAETITGQKTGKPNGVLIIGFTSNSAAQNAGVQKGDTVISLDGQKISSMDDLLLYVRRAGVGSTVKLVVIRNGKNEVITVKVGAKPANLSVPPSQTTTP